MACGATDHVSVEHLIPLARGGRHSVGNLAPLCRSCNSSKSHLTWSEWRLSDRPQAVAAFGPRPRTAVKTAVRGRTEESTEAASLTEDGL